jgi:hypothetical protein
MKRTKKLLLFFMIFVIVVCCYYYFTKKANLKVSVEVEEVPVIIPVLLLPSTPLHYDESLRHYSKTINATYISVKTSEKYHQSRLRLIMKTWLQTVPSHNVHVVTDASDNVTELLQQEGYHVHIADCPKKHQPY